MIIMLVIVIGVMIVCIVLLLFVFSTLRNGKKETWAMTKPKIACIYAYFEKNDEYKDNLQYFVENGILDHVDYYLVMNGDYNIVVPRKPNIHIIERPNIGYDFGAWSHALTKIDVSQYAYFVFMNTSVKGPYMKNGARDWTKPFIDQFTDGVKLVGTTINIMELGPADSIRQYVPCDDSMVVCPHVQSMFFVLDREALEFLLARNFFDENEICGLNFHQVIGEKEVGMSYHILKNGWNIASILPEYQQIDYRTVKKNINWSAHSGDGYYENAYFGRTLHPYEVIFFKTNRIPLPKDL